MQSHIATFQLYPVRCTCGRPLSHLKDVFLQLAETYSPAPNAIGQALDGIGLVRMCCRTNMLNPAILQLTEKYYTPSSLKSFDTMNMSVQDPKNRLQPSSTSTSTSEDDFGIAELTLVQHKPIEMRSVGSNYMVPVLGAVISAV